uniref:Uncharacterized protein n=1 Tax=Meloidogyne enterolobii TaxID=390850 RepID=A0A6V7VQ43_MELEN|nr:unnamed protein product [Meloidogyne enterolobii]
MPSETTENENNHEDYLIKNVAEKIRKMEGFNEENKEGSEENKLNINEDENEEEEQKLILKRLYSRYGQRRAKDLLNRIESLLLFVENGISKKEEMNSSVNSSTEVN